MLGMSKHKRYSVYIPFTDHEVRYWYIDGVLYMCSDVLITVTIFFSIFFSRGFKTV